jgi:hypothetical protein
MDNTKIFDSTEFLFLAKYYKKSFCLVSKNASLQASRLVSLMESQKTLDAEIFDIKSGFFTKLF